MKNTYTLKLFTAFTLILICSLKGNAQDLEWVKSTHVITGNLTAIANEIDSDGNNYVIGTIQGSFDADFGDDEYLIDGVVVDRRLFVIKMDVDGNFLWAKPILSSTGIYSDCLPYDIEAVGNDLIYIGGIFFGQFDFDAGPGIEALASTTPGKYDGFVLALDGDGNFIWVQKYGGSEIDLINGISTDKDGNVFVAGTFSETVDFDQGPGVHLETADGLSDGYILKLNMTGDFQWVRVFSGDIITRMNQIDISPLNEIYAIGNFKGTIDADPGISEDLLTSPLDVYSLIIVKLDAAGNYIWSKKTDGPNPGYEPVPERILADSTCVYATSFCKDSLDLDPGIAVYKLYTGTRMNAFIQKLDADGNFIWGKNMGGSADVRAIEIKKGPNNHIYIGGIYLNGSADLDPSEETFIVTTPGPPEMTGKFDLFIQEFEANGELKWVYGSEALGAEFIRDFEIDEFGDLIFFGTSGTTSMDFDLGPETALIPSSHGMFLWKLGTCDNEYVTLNEFLCDSYTVPSGAETYTVPGTYFDAVPSIYGCDTIFTIVLTDPTESITLIFDGETYTAYPAGATYAWIDCDSDMDLIPGETDQTYTPITAGNYAAIISYGDCVDTTACVSTINVGLNTTTELLDLTVYPNPSNGLFNITVSEPMQIQIYSSIGQLITVKRIDKGQYEMNLKGLSSGIYLLSASSLDGKMQINKKILIN